MQARQAWATSLEAQSTYAAGISALSTQLAGVINSIEVVVNQLSEDADNPSSMEVGGLFVPQAIAWHGKPFTVMHCIP